MKRIGFVLAGILFAGALFADGARLSVSDLAVHSDKTQYKYVGKGIAEMIAVELRKSPDITLIERERRTALLEELEFSLSDLADSGRQLEVGRMLAAGYMVFGELVDMGEEVLIGLRLADVQTDRIVWSEQLLDRLSRYDYIAAYFASSILQYLGAQIHRSTQTKLASGSQKKAEAVIALSTAIDLYDRDEKQQARRQLDAVRRLDPKSDAASWLLSKLVANTTRFKVLMEQYYSYLNPAFLGVMREDMLHLAASTDVFPITTHIPVRDVNYAVFARDKAISEMDFTVRLGYAFPIGRLWGMRVDVLPVLGSLNRGWLIAEGEEESKLNVPRYAAGALLDLGWHAAPRLAFGAGIGLYSRSSSDLNPTAAYLFPDKTLLSFNAGLLYRNPEESLLFDSRVGWNTETYEISDQDLNVSGQAGAPVFLENTLTLSDRRSATFLIIKQIDAFSLDRTYFFATLMPAVERFLAPWFSLRVGLEGSLALLGESLQPGYGLLAGMTFRSVRRLFDVDLNLSWRKRPSRVAEGLLYTDLVALMNLTWSGVRAVRKGRTIPR